MNTTDIEMINIIINDKEYSVPKGIPLIRAIEMQGIRIPRLCYHSDFYKNGTSGSGSCGLCVIKNNITGKVIRSCIMKTAPNMNISTNTPDCEMARKTAMQLILANHPLECLTCSRNGRCELQTTAAEMGIREIPFTKAPMNLPHETSSSSIHIDPNKCIKCARCVVTCKVLQQVQALQITENTGYNTVLQPIDGVKLADTMCISCGQCVAHCPVAGIVEKNDTAELSSYLSDPALHTVVQIAPAVRVALGEEFDMPAGTLVTGKIYTALRLLGFDKIFDTNFGADITIMEEAAEFTKRFTKYPETLPIITSCCPSWVDWCEKFYPDLLDHLSSAKSPHQMLGVMVKSYYAEKQNIDPTSIRVVSIMPCTSKKEEIKRHPDMKITGTPDVDLVVTTRELAQMIKEAGIDFANLEAQDVDQLMGEYSGAGAIFGSTGGVMEAGLRTAYYNITGEDLPDHALEFEVARGFAKSKTATINIQDKAVKIAVVHGIINAKAILEEIREAQAQGEPAPYDFIEVMACYGGCIGGGGQPYSRHSEKTRELRSKGLYTDDANSSVRFSHKNPMVIKLYEEYLQAPLSDKAHHLLHTHYEPKGISFNY